MFSRIKLLWDLWSAWDYLKEKVGIGGDMNLGRLGGVAAMAAGAAAVLSGLACGLTHLIDGTFGAHMQECMAQVVAGIAVFSPGLGKLKVDRV